MRRQGWYEMHAAQQRPARPKLEIQDDAEQTLQKPAKPGPEPGQAGFAETGMKPAQPGSKPGLAGFHGDGLESAQMTSQVGKAESNTSSKLPASEVQVIRSFIPHKLEVGTWKTYVLKKKWSSSRKLLLTG